MRIEPRESENWLLVLGVPILSAIVASSQILGAALTIIAISIPAIPK